MTLAPRVCLLAYDASTKYKLGYTKIVNINIGNNVFIGANSVVTHNIEDNSAVAGNPAKLICKYDEYINKKKIQMKKSKCYDNTYTIRNKKITD